ncbi:MAG: ABC transporter ATP-binding protein [Clostridia bacterium]|nr:ABC transporter ATP-binding protein [Clostridia bacterium]
MDWNGAAVIDVQNLSVVYPDGTKAIDDISFSLTDGETAALIGANGAGKTSLILSLVGVIPSKGDVAVGDVRLCRETIGEVRRLVGVVFQNPDDQLFMPTIYDDVAFGLRNYGIAETEIEQRVDCGLQELRIAHLKQRSSLKLSAGEKRTAAIATVLVMEPTVMLFDEPTAFLDPKARRNLIKLLGKLPHTKLIATHDIPFAAQVCDRAILLKSGRIFADGPSSELLYDEKTMDDCGVEAIPLSYQGGR